MRPSAQSRYTSPYIRPLLTRRDMLALRMKWAKCGASSPALLFSCRDNGMPDLRSFLGAKSATGKFGRACSPLDHVPAL